jgi:hypothetical protein
MLEWKGISLVHRLRKEKFWQAVHSLATGDDSIQQRLAAGALVLIRLEPGDLPQKLRQEFDAVRHELTKENAEGDEGTIAATIRKLTPEEASKIAERILHIYTELHGGI